MMNFKTIFAASVLTLTAGIAQADSLNADISNDAFKFEYIATNSRSNLDLNAAILYHDKNGQAYSAGGQVGGQALYQNTMRGALGGKLYYLDVDHDDGFALGLGGMGELYVPAFPGISFSAELYYSPTVLSFSGIKNFYELTLKGKYQVLENGSVYVGYRKANVSFEKGGKGDLDKGIHLGFELKI